MRHGSVLTCGIWAQERVRRVPLLPQHQSLERWAFGRRPTLRRYHTSLYPMYTLPAATPSSTSRMFSYQSFHRPKLNSSRQQKPRGGLLASGYAHDGSAPTPVGACTFTARTPVRMRRKDKVRIGVRLTLDGVTLLDEGRTNVNDGLGCTRSVFVERLLRRAQAKGWLYDGA